MRNLIIAAALAAAVPAQAEVLFTVSTSAGRIDLHGDSGPCINAALRAEYVGKDGERIAGCWVAMSRDLVQVAFLDGDVSRIPSAVLRRPESS